MVRVKRWMLGITMCCGFVSLLPACATSFTGSPHVEGGRGGCVSKCKAQGMECVGMVYMGEYSDACVCAVPGATAMERHNLLRVAAATGGAGAGVAMQMQRQAQHNSTH